MRDWGLGDDKVNWEVESRDEKSVSADLRVAEGRDLVRQLLATADVMVENFKPGTLEKWGLGPDVLRAINPGLIIARMSGYGQTGPYSDRAGFGGIGEAMGGWRYIVGEPDRPPQPHGHLDRRHADRNVWLHGRARRAPCPRLHGQGASGRHRAL